MARSRVFNISTHVINQETGESYLTEDKIREALSHKTIKRWAYILHDKDVYTEEEELASDGKVRAGERKPPHWHIVLETPQANCEVTLIAKWFGIPENFIELPKGRGAFLDCVQYLTHERDEQQEMGKRLYPDEEVRSNFNFRETLDKRAENRTKYGRDLDDREALRHKVLYEGLSLREASEKYPYEYEKDVATLERHRLRYLNTLAPLPKVKINIYVEGEAGIGKGLMSKALARVLVDREGNMFDDDIYFETGDNRVTFEGYDGQPVIIWNDCRAQTLLEKLGSRENVFECFDPTPNKVRQNVKYGSCTMLNEINIVNSVQPYEDFVRDLTPVKEFLPDGREVLEDVGQAKRRFPMFFVIRKDDFDFAVNLGVMNGTLEYDRFQTIKGIQGSMRELVQRINSQDEEHLRTGEQAMLKAPREQYDKMKERLVAENREMSEADFQAMIAGWGEQSPEDEQLPGQMDLGDFIEVPDDEVPFNTKGGEK